MNSDKKPEKENLIERKISKDKEDMLTCLKAKHYMISTDIPTS
jgi:hypothetical protein